MLATKLGVSGIAIALLLSAAARRASAQDVAPEDLYEDKSKKLDEGEAAKLGVGVRLRYVFMPKAIIEAFVDSASSGVGHPGFGLEVTRRKANFDIVFGLEYSSIAPEDGLFLEKGDTPGVPGENPDFVEFDGFALLGLDVSFLWHAQIAPKIDFRYGAGIGVAAVLGDVLQTDTDCATVGSLDSCLNGDGTPRIPPSPEQNREKSDDVPPVVPIVNILIGARFEIAPNLTANVETGFRDLFYAGVGTTYLF